LGRLVIVFFVVCVLALPAVAEEQADCSEWKLKELRPGMTFEEAADEHTYRELLKFRDKNGYRRFVWRSEDKLEKIDLHVDMRGKPPRIVGITTSVPRSDKPPKEFLASLVERWGPPTTRKGQGAFTLYTWRNEDCDAFVLVSVRNERNAAVGIETALRSIEAHAEYNRRLKERAEKEAGRGE
jgi:hypothetical protein